MILSQEQSLEMIDYPRKRNAEIASSLNKEVVMSNLSRLIDQRIELGKAYLKIEPSMQGAILSLMGLNGSDIKQLLGI